MAETTNGEHPKIQIKDLVSQEVEHYKDPDMVFFGGGCCYGFNWQC